MLGRALHALLMHVPYLTVPYLPHHNLLEGNKPQLRTWGTDTFSLGTSQAHTAVTFSQALSIETGE